MNADIKTDCGKDASARFDRSHYSVEENLAEPFSRGDTFIHRLDPRFRLGAALALSVVLAVLSQPVSIGVGLAGAVMLLVLSRPPRRPLLRRLSAVSFFLVFLWVLVPLTAGGETLYSMGPLHFSRNGILLCLLVSGKSLAVVCIFLALVASMSAADLGRGLQGIGVPLTFAQLFLFTYRYSHVLLESWKRLQTAARLRCFQPRTSLHTYKTYANMLGMLFLNSFERSERIHEAMLLRGFDGRFRSLSLFRAGKKDAVFLFLALTCAIALLVWDIG